MIAALLFENENAADMEIPRENIMQLTEHQFVLPVPETAYKRKPQKRCKVCYKKGVCKDTLQLSELSKQPRTSLFSVLNFITLNSIIGFETQLDQKVLLRSNSIVHSK